MKHFLMHPPAWLERILSRSAKYRAWVIKEVCAMLHEEAIKSIYDDMS